MKSTIFLILVVSVSAVIPILSSIAVFMATVQVAPEFLNALGLDAFVIGNHEFDFGPEVLATFIGNLTAPVMSCNLDVSRSPVLAGKVQRYVIKTLASGLKVGLVGFTPVDTAELSSPGKDVSFLSPSEAASGCIADAKAAGANMILGVTHVGYGVDLELASTFRDFDAIIGGHSHSFLYTGTPPNLLVTPETEEGAEIQGPYPTYVENDGKTIPVATAYWGSRYLGVLDFDFQKSNGVVSSTGNLIVLGGVNSTNNVKDDDALAGRIQELKVPLQQYLDEEIGSTTVVLDGERVVVRNEESNLGDLITDAMVWFAETRTGIISSSDLPFVAHMNGGGIRQTIPPGPITQGQILGVLPFGNYIIIKRVSASALLEAINNGFSQWTGDSNAAGRFGQYSNMKVSFSPSEGVPPTERVVRAVIYDRNGNEIDLDSYNGDVIVIMNNFIGAGGDGYTSFARAPLILDTSVGLDEAVGSYISEFSPVSPSVEGRIVNCVESPDNDLCLKTTPAPPPSTTPSPPPSVTCPSRSGTYHLLNVACGGMYLAYPLNCSDTKARFGTDSQYKGGRTVWSINTDFNSPSPVLANSRGSCSKNVLASNSVPTFGSNANYWQYIIEPASSSCDAVHLIAYEGQEKGKYLSAASMCAGLQWKTKGTGRSTHWQLVQV